MGSNPLQVLLTLLVKRILNITSVSIHRTEWRNMYNLKYADYDGIYHGFNLKKGYYYGEDTKTGKLIATSGWCAYGSVALYELKNGRWKLTWVNIKEEIEYLN